jgi:drug/metabolite transporter (DMT)-like permease
MIVYYIVTLISVLLETAKNVFSNDFSKTELKSKADIYLFNTLMYGASFLVLLLIACVRGFFLSWYSLGMALAFALVSGGMQTTMLRALRHGPLAYVNFIQTSGLVIPALYGAILLQQGISLMQWIALPLLLLSFALVLDLKRSDTGTSGPWFLDAMLSFLCCGLVGVVQAAHQASPHAHEIDGFLCLTFLFIVIMNLIPWLISRQQTSPSAPIPRRMMCQSLLSGAFMGVVNTVNLFLVGVMPSIVFFPIANGGLLIMTMLAAVVFFKERLRLVQWLGILLGLGAMCILGI